MAAVTPMAEQMGMLLAKCTPEEIAQIFTVVNKMQPVASPPAVAAGANSQRKKRSKKTTASKVAQRGGPTFKVIPTGAQTPPSDNIAPIRPLNSWMAFRSKLYLKSLT